MKSARFLIILLALFYILPNICTEEFKESKSRNYARITDCIIRDIDHDGISEIIISYFENRKKFVDVYKVAGNELKLLDTVEVPYYTVFFDVGDIDNDKTYDFVFLSSDGLYYRPIGSRGEALKHIDSIRSEIVVPQPELLKAVNMVIDLNGDGVNELLIENIRAIEIFETASFKKISSINLQTVLEYSLVPGQFYPQYIFYTLPIILVNDLDNDNKKEIVTKFPDSINIYSQKNPGEWQLKNRIRIGSDNVYFLSNSYVKFAFPVLADIDNNKDKEIIVSSANLDMPHFNFEAVGDIYYYNKQAFNMNPGKKIVVKGIPLNLPYFFNISNSKLKDFVLPVVPFNLFSIFGLLSGSGSIKVPFLLYQQKEDNFDMRHPVKLFEITVKIENIPSFVEELPLDQYRDGGYPDFYYFIHDYAKKTVDIMYYNANEKGKYQAEVAKTLSIPNYSPELPSTLKLGRLTNNIKKDIIFITHMNLFIITRK